MKVLIASAFIFASLSASAANWTAKTFSKVFYAPTEVELVQEVEAAIPAIEAGEDEELTRSMKREKCDLSGNRISAQNLIIKKIYKRDGKVLNPVYRGILVVKHNRCFEIYK